MHLGVDDARQDVQPAAVNEGATGSARQVADPCDRRSADADVADARAVLIDDDPAREDQIESLCHPLAKRLSHTP